MAVLVKPKNTTHVQLPEGALMEDTEHQPFIATLRPHMLVRGSSSANILWVDVDEDPCELLSHRKYWDMTINNFLLTVKYFPLGKGGRIHGQWVWVKRGKAWSIELAQLLPKDEGEACTISG